MGEADCVGDCTVTNEIGENDVLVKEDITFDFDVTDFVKSGRNTVACAVNNETIVELEAGGIMKPVVLYIPGMEAEDK